MSLISRLRALASSRLRKEGAAENAVSDGESFLVFANTGEVIQAERILKEEGMRVRVMAPPPALRTGCDMVLVVPLIYGFRAVALLEDQKLAPLRMSPVGGELLEPVSLFQAKDYGEWVMVRAANMKITVEKRSGRIVNVSGGGCPDVPYLATRMVGKDIREADLLKEQGQTLCGYALYLAARELRKRQGESGV